MNTTIDHSITDSADTTAVTVTRPDVPGVWAVLVSLPGDQHFLAVYAPAAQQAPIATQQFSTSDRSRSPQDVALRAIEQHSFWAQQKPAPTACENCGTSFNDCTDGIHGGGKACCGACFLTDQHGMKAAGVL